MNIDNLIVIANELGLKYESEQLSIIKEKEKCNDPELILPLVGEFSSGKTTLINSLTDSKVLQTATKPTTSTIYDIHFGCAKNTAIVTNEDGSRTTIEDISSVDNEEFVDKPFITIQDTSTKIPSSIVLIDTPGLSSPEPKHKQTLINFLPQADAILLVCDINQQLTRSITNFIKSIELSKRPLYLILTKCDTKSELEINNAIKYITNNNKELAITKIITTSAINNNNDNLLQLIETIQLHKKDILTKVNAQRCTDIAHKLELVIDDLLKVSCENNYEEAIQNNESRLKKIQKQIQNLIDGANNKLEDSARALTRQFEDTIFNELDYIAAGKSIDFNTEVISAVNTHTNIILDNYKKDIQQIIKQEIRQHSNKDFAISEIPEMDLNSLSINGITYTVDLNSIGHEHDQAISTTIKIATAAATVATIAGAAKVAGATGAKVATSIGGKAAATTVVTTAAKTENLINLADTASDLGSIISNAKMRKAIQYADASKQALPLIEDKNKEYGQSFGSKKGLVESVVGLVTDATMGKPQRRRAIHNYIDSTLIPQFKTAMNNNRNMVISMLQTILYDNAQTTIDDINNSLNKLYQESQNQKAEFNTRLKTLRKYKKELMSN